MLLFYLLMLWIMVIRFGDEVVVSRLMLVGRWLKWVVLVMVLFNCFYRL